VCTVFVAFLLFCYCSKIENKIYVVNSLLVTSMNAACSIFSCVSLCVCLSVCPVGAVISECLEIETLYWCLGKVLISRLIRLESRSYEQGALMCPLWTLNCWMPWATNFIFSARCVHRTSGRIVVMMFMLPSVYLRWACIMII